jgi:signal transduction histidine kinase
LIRSAPDAAPPGVDRLRLLADLAPGLIHGIRNLQGGVFDDAEAVERLCLLANLAPGLIHDIRNLLHVVAGSAALVRREASAEAGRFLDAIGTSAHDASLLADLLLRLTRPGNPAPVAPQPTLDANRRLLDLQALLARILQRDVVLRLRCAPGLWLVRAGVAEFDSALLNLVTNARDALRGADRGVGQVVIRTQNLRLRSPDDALAEQVRISVADNGRGMDRATLARAGEPFFTTKGENGTGLGLSQVRRFAAAAGGEVRVRSALGLGTVVHLLLPRAAAPDGNDAMRPRPIALQETACGLRSGGGRS